jgi:hypothetical protein
VGGAVVVSGVPPVESCQPWPLDADVGREVHGQLNAGLQHRQRCQVRHEVHVADGRAKSTAERLEIFACTGVTASEYEVLLRGRMRREALGAGSTHACYQERIDLAQRSRRKLARTRLRAYRTAATNTAVRTAEPVAPQRLAPQHPPASVAAWSDWD